MKFTLAVLVLTLSLLFSCGVSKTQLRVDELAAKVEVLEQQNSLLVRILQQFIAVYNGHIDDLHAKSGRQAL